ncbi:MAG: aminotransferase class I/II-fold pyridoxal phosphate-dependent enzyme [Comamonadaceae bacterium]|nr:MAG: aminotransferase class I/II-fold pyridoxal phosphate-dependent enzyme [Comamonadaceae bacterium]
MAETPRHWLKRIREGAKPAYILLAELIAEDIHRGVLSVRDPLPTLRELARDLGLNYTTVARGYTEARKRGLIDTHVGIGTVVRGSHPGLPIRSGTGAAMSMNSPPEPLQPELLAQMNAAAAAVFGGAPAGIHALLRYQDFGGDHADREAGVQWLRSHLPRCQAGQVLVAPGIHSVLMALMTLLARPGDTVCVESLCYPGIKAMAAQLRIRLQALNMDDEGVLPDAFEHACKTLQPRALICNPTLHNPTTTPEMHMLPAGRQLPNWGPVLGRPRRTRRSVGGECPITMRSTLLLPLTLVVRVCVLSRTDYSNTTSSKSSTLTRTSSTGWCPTSVCYADSPSSTFHKTPSRSSRQRLVC